jgi:hypothetical protein
MSPTRIPAGQTAIVVILGNPVSAPGSGTQLIRIFFYHRLGKVFIAMMRAVAVPLLLAVAAAQARNDPLPQFDRSWAPLNLSAYEGELRGYYSREAPGRPQFSINPAKVCNRAELIDIAWRNNPATCVAW